jgi:hypothetical protein
MFSRCMYIVFILMSTGFAARKKIVSISRDFSAIGGRHNHTKILAPPFSLPIISLEVYRSVLHT